MTRIRDKPASILAGPKRHRVFCATSSSARIPCSASAKGIVKTLGMSFVPYRNGPQIGSSAPPFRGASIPELGQPKRGEHVSLTRPDLMFIKGIRQLRDVGRSYNDVTDVIRVVMRQGVTIHTVIRSTAINSDTSDPALQAARDALIGFLAATTQAEANRIAQRAGIEAAKGMPGSIRGGSRVLIGSWLLCSMTSSALGWLQARSPGRLDYSARSSFASEMIPMVSRRRWCARGCRSDRGQQSACWPPKVLELLALRAHYVGPMSHIL